MSNLSSFLSYSNECLLGLQLFSYFLILLMYLNNVLFASIRIINFLVEVFKCVPWNFTYAVKMVQTRHQQPDRRILMEAAQRSFVYFYAS